MTTQPIIAGAEEFSSDPESGPQQDTAQAGGVLLCHGFTGSPASMTPWGRDLAARGYHVRVPRLPGHGTTWHDLNRTDWTEWYRRVDTALDELRDRCTRVAVGGLSMGGCLALRLAQERHDDVDALVLVNPALHLRRFDLKLVPVFKHIMRSMPGIGNDIAKPGVDETGYDRTPLAALASQLKLWRVTRSRLEEVDQPMLFFKSVTDHVVDDSTIAIVRSTVNSQPAEFIDLHNSFHVATLDYDADEIFDTSAAFLNKHLFFAR